MGMRLAKLFYKFPVLIPDFATFSMLHNDVRQEAWGYEAKRIMSQDGVAGDL